MTDKFDSYIKKVEKIQKELDGRITNKQEMDVYIQFRLEGMAEVGAIEMLNSFGYKELLAIAKFKRLYSHYFPNELAEQNKRYREALEEISNTELPGIPIEKHINLLQKIADEALEELKIKSLSDLTEKEKQEFSKKLRTWFD